MKRRQWLTASLMGTAGVWLGADRGRGESAPARPPRRIRPDFDRLVPADKRLDPAWVASLAVHREPLRVTWPESKWIGMPVGGICCGQVYLGGDGRLWLWDVLNQVNVTRGEHYKDPVPPTSPIEQGFAVRIEGEKPRTRPLDHRGWERIEFIGEYPIGRVAFRAAEEPLEVDLEAFSPFIPLDTESSALPATVLRYTLRNKSGMPLTVAFAAWLQNPVSSLSLLAHDEVWRNRVVETRWGRCLVCNVEKQPASASAPGRPDILFDDFERETHGDWTVEGTAFGAGPVRAADVPAYQGDLGMEGNRAINSHAAAPGADVVARDAATGTLTSRPFRVERKWIRLLVGGGADADRTCVELVVDDQVVRRVAGRNANRMAPLFIPAGDFEGREARLRIADRATGGWGNIGVDHIVFTDVGPQPAPLDQRHDAGTMALALVGGADRAAASIGHDAPPGPAFEADGIADAATDAGRPVGALSRRLTLAPGGEAEVVAILTWYFPNTEKVAFGALATSRRREYARRFADALAVADHVATRLDELTRRTRLWRDTWYDTTLPRWLMYRIGATFCNLATSTCHWFDDGRFYGWEGVGCCAGTCTHVWHYAQAVGRLFPSLERAARELVDFGLALEESGAIRFRGEYNHHPAVDGQAGSILRVLREHQMSADGEWLRRMWPRVKKAIEWLVAQDRDGDGLMEGAQHNTLDADWYGPVAWLSGMRVAALRAGEVMARDVGDEAAAARYRTLAEQGTAALVRELFDGEYFINRPDPAHADTVNSGTGCHIDQVLGQWWAWQLGLPRVLPPDETVSALRALWRYNFVPDVGPWREVNRPGRWFALAGEAGLVMCTFPRDDWDFDRAKGGPGRPPGFAGYFNECMTGFEYQAAAHMVYEGLVTEGLAVARAIHDRYAPAKRNPYNEIECGDHYARAMSAYSLLLAALGFEHDGPAGRLGFAPRLYPNDFRCPFTAAEGWGTYAQRRQDGGWVVELILRDGRLRLAELRLALPDAGRVTAEVDGRALAAPLVRRLDDGRVALRWDEPLRLEAGQGLKLKVAPGTTTA